MNIITDSKFNGYKKGEGTVLLYLILYRSSKNHSESSSNNKANIAAREDQVIKSSLLSAYLPT